MVSTGKTRLEAAKDGVSPFEFGQITLLALAHDDGLVGADSLADHAESRQGVAADGCTRRQIVVGASCYGAVREAWNRCELDVTWAHLVIERRRCDKGHLVFRAPPWLTPWVLAYDVVVVELNMAAQAMERVALGNRGHELVVDQLGGSIAPPKLALERQRVHASLGLTEQVHRQKPDGQRRLGAGENGADDHRGLVPTANALKSPTPALTRHARSGAFAARATEPGGPSRGHRRPHTVACRAKHLKTSGKDSSP